jgi:hypothetical protein
MESGRGRIWKATATARRRLVSGAAVTAAAALVLGACSSEDIAEKVAEEAVEQQLEADGQSGDVDIDVDDGNVTIQGEDGEIQLDVDEENGQTVVSTPDGQTIIGSGELPDGFPSEVLVPEGLTILSGTSMDSADGQVFIINGSVGGDFTAATEAYASALTGAGFEQQSMTESTDGTFFAFVGDGWNISGGIYPSSSGDGSDVGINVVPATP